MKSTSSKCSICMLLILAGQFQSHPAMVLMTGKRASWMRHWQKQGFWRPMTLTEGRLPEVAIQHRDGPARGISSSQECLGGVGSPRPKA
jgi:hypothetical protein